MEKRFRDEILSCLNTAEDLCASLKNLINDDCQNCLGDNAIPVVRIIAGAAYLELAKLKNIIDRNKTDIVFHRCLPQCKRSFLSNLISHILIP